MASLKARTGYGSFILAPSRIQDTLLARVSTFRWGRASPPRPIPAGVTSPDYGDSTDLTIGDDVALANDISAPLRHADRFFIGGEWVKPSSDAVIDVIDSTSEELFFSVAEAQEADMARAVGAGAPGLRRRARGRA